MRKIGILTLPLLGNYGGMLQAFALLSASRTITPHVSFINLMPDDVINLRRNSLRWLKTRIMQIAYKYNITRQTFTFLPILQLEVALKFSIRHLNQKALISLKELRTNHLNYNSFIVGSDQIWRQKYTRGYASGTTYFLDFASDYQIINSIAYSASFGSDVWEGSSDETEACKHLVKQFKSVSVRENSGVSLCKDVFGVNSVQMPDPTLLLNTTDYDKIIISERTWTPNNEYIASYILDETIEKAELLKNCEEKMHTQLQHLMPHATAKKRQERFPISVPQWLRLIRDCEYFITDSFHGCVFAIIYNKPFVCLGNEGRGNARFDTLLETFGLEDRFITDTIPEKLMQVLNTPIDWERVNAIHNSERNRGINFLKESLTLR